MFCFYKTLYMSADQRSTKALKINLISLCNFLLLGNAGASTLWDLASLFHYLSASLLLPLSWSTDPALSSTEATACRKIGHQNKIKGPFCFSVLLLASSDTGTTSEPRMSSLTERLMYSRVFPRISFYFSLFLDTKMFFFCDHKFLFATFSFLLTPGLCAFIISILFDLEESFGGVSGDCLSIAHSFLPAGKKEWIIDYGMMPGEDSWERQLSIQCTWKKNADQESLSSFLSSLLALILLPVPLFLLEVERKMPPPPPPPMTEWARFIQHGPTPNLGSRYLKGLEKSSHLKLKHG